MSLNWSVSNVRDWQEVTADGIESDITTCLVFMSMPLGFHAITERNWQEIATRVAIWQVLEGPRLRAWEGDTVVGKTITASDVHRRIGLTTNASTKTNAKFRKDVIHNLEKAARYDIVRVMKALEGVTT